MDKAYVLKNFEAFYTPLIEQEKVKLYEYMSENKQLLVDEVIEAFKRLCITTAKMQKYESKNAISYMGCSYLRTSILDKSYFAYINSYDEYWYLDRNESFEIYDITWLFSRLDTLCELLVNESEKYKPFIQQEDIDKIIMDTSLSFYFFLGHIVSVAFPYIVETQEFKSMLISDNFAVMLSEYENAPTVVFIDNNVLLDENDIIELLEAKTEEEYKYKVFKNLDLSRGNYSKIILHSSRLLNNNFNYSDFNKGSFYCTDFSGSCLEETDFSCSIICQANFTNCNITNSDFSYTFGYTGIMENIPVALFGVNFQNANLSGVNFQNADLKEANFKGAIMNNIDFTDTNLLGAEIETKNKHKLLLSDEQIKQIKWI